MVLMKNSENVMTLAFCVLITWGPTTPGGPGGPVLPWKPCEKKT